MLTAEQFREWKQHPTTEEVFSFLKDYRQRQSEKSTLYPTAEMTFKETAIKAGVLQGLDALLEMDVED